MINYNNIGIESSESSTNGSGLITAIQIIMNSTPNTKEAIEVAKNTYTNIHRKLEKPDEKINVIADSMEQTRE